MSDKKPDQAPADTERADTEEDDEREKALEDTFPASDPPASTGTTGPTGDRKPRS